MGFTIKTLTPVFYSIRERLVDENYYSRRKLDFTALRKKEHKIDKEINEVLYEF